MGRAKMTVQVRQPNPFAELLAASVDNLELEVPGRRGSSESDRPMSYGVTPGGLGRHAQPPNIDAIGRLVVAKRPARPSLRTTSQDEVAAMTLYPSEEFRQRLRELDLVPSSRRT